MLTSRAAPGPRDYPIVVVVAVDAPVVPAWAALVVDQLLERPSVELRGALIVPPPRHEPGPGPGTALLRALERLDRRISRAPLDALAPTTLPGAVPVVASFGAQAPDVVVDLTTAGLPADAPAAAGPRVWRLQHPGGARLGDATVAFWALRARATVLVTELVEHRPAPGRALYRSVSAVWPRSLYRTRNAACWKTAHFVSRCLAVAEREGWDSDPQPAAAQPLPAPPPDDRPPAAADVVGWARRTFGGVARRALGRRSVPASWSVAVRPAADGGRLPQEFGGARDLVPSPGDDLADPFLHRDGDRVHVFVEEYRQALGRGVISCWELTADGAPARPRVVLEEPFHLSYPQVFEHEGRVYMLPETGDAGEVRLYAAAAYPDRWRLERVLLADTAAFDPTLVRHDGRLWLFAVVPVPGGANTDELSIFHAERLEGPWLPHRANPVVSDARCARPAGRVLRIGDALVRPAQDCSRDYGYAVTFQRIDLLTPTDYRETTIGRLEPGWRAGNLRTHTYNRGAGFEVVDAYRR
jgi:hypothetical protein